MRKFDKNMKLSTVIVKTKNIKPCKNKEEHYKRVLTREATPWIRYKLLPRFPKKMVQQ